MMGWLVDLVRSKGGNSTPDDLMNLLVVYSSDVVDRMRRLVVDGCSRLLG